MKKGTKTLVSVALLLCMLVSSYAALPAAGVATARAEASVEVMLSAKSDDADALRIDETLAPDASGEPSEGKSPASAEERLASVVEQPSPVVEQPTSVEEQPTPIEERPNPVEEPPIPVEKLPTPAEEPPIPDEETDEETEEGATTGTEATTTDRSVTIHTNGQPGSFAVGDTVILEAVLKGYEDVQYAVAWEHSLDGDTWSSAPGVSDQLKYTFTMDEETATWYWRVVIEPLVAIEHLEVPLSDGSRRRDGEVFIVCVAGILLLAGCAIAIVIRRRNGKKVSS